MTLWFGPFIELEPAHGYFYLCPSCFEECVVPELEDVQQTLAKLNPAAAAYLERERELDAGRGPAGSGEHPGSRRGRHGDPTRGGSAARDDVAEEASRPPSEEAVASADADPTESGEDQAGPEESGPEDARTERTGSDEAGPEGDGGGASANDSKSREG